MFPIDIFASNIPTPGPAPQCQSEWHSIVEVTAVSQALGLIHHDTADLNPSSQFNDPVLPRGMDPAAVPLSIEWM